MELVHEGDRVAIHKLSPCLYFRQADLLERQQCNSIYIAGDNSVAVVDVPTIEAAVEIEQKVKKIFDMPLRYIFITHIHDDHVNGLSYFFDKPVTVVCARNAVSCLQGKTGTEFIGIDNKVSFFLGQTEIQCRTMGRTMHSPWDLFVTIPESNALCAGDCVVDPWILYYHNAEIDQWIYGLKELTKENYKLVLPGHGGVYDANFISETSDYLQALRELVHKTIEDLHLTAHSDMNADDLALITKEALSRPEAKLIIEKGQPEAERQFRMVFRKSLYTILR